ncbi:MAG: hypothetical protein K2Z81_06915 [Cyanobacteria bacterium]|nr:hypothetical protein [Cyanobacteriota bacterium]
MTDDDKDRRRQQDEHNKRLEKEHQQELKEREKHLRQLETNARILQRADQRERVTGSSGGVLRSRLCQQSLSEMKDLKWQGLGRDVHDFLTARQHGWDRASGSGGFGSGDRMP